MTYYTIRPATLADLPTIVHHRRAMFTDMGLSGDYEAMDAHFGLWLQQAMTSQNYWGWLVETEADEIAAGGGVGLLPRPPSPQDFNEQWAFVYNVYTEPAHRRQGLARQIMETIHHWCRQRGLKTVGLSASEFGQPLYEALGYRPSETLMFLKLEDY
ncbi:MAG TPA: GNAT family N-acetyltransferase [Anaerolineae bacterium]|nr:GNAT family N-acetyltransferase [Anaerolineae bacterium]